MNIFLIGCEFTGKTTLGSRIVQWQQDHMADTGKGLHFHDHFTIPNAEMSAESKASFLATTPQIKEMYQRFMIVYHMQPETYRRPDKHHMGFFIEEAVYGPLYYGYGGSEAGASIRSPEGQRTKMARAFEEEILKHCPQMVLVLMKATPEVIRERMRRNEPVYAQGGFGFGVPTRGVVQDKDVEHVLERFEQEYQWSNLRNKFTLDTSDATVDETIAEFLAKNEPFISDVDKQRIARGKA